MSVLTRAQLQSAINNAITTNAQGQITGDALNTILIDLNDSLSNLTTDTTSLGLYQYDTSKSYGLGELTWYDGNFYVSIIATTGAFTSADFIKLTNYTNQSDFSVLFPVYSDATTFNIGDGTLYNNQYFICDLNGTLDVTPSDASPNWSLVSVHNGDESKEWVSGTYYLQNQIISHDNKRYVLTKDTALGAFESTTSPSSDTTNWSQHNLTNTRDNTVLVKSVDDLPTPISNVITLADSTVYEVEGAVSIGANRLVMGVNTTLRGKSPALDYITSTTTGALITSTNSFRIFEMGFQADSGTIFDLNGTGVEICLMFGVRFFGTGGLGDVADYDLFEITTGLFAGYSAGLTFTGAFDTLLLLDVTFIDVNGLTNIDLGTATFNSIKITDCDFTLPTASTGIDIAPSGANINAGGGGIIVATNFRLTGTAVATVGYSELDLLWSVSANYNINNSDRYSPTGWGHYQDGETTPATIATSTTPTKLLIDGLGSATNESYLPQSIRGVSSLWDTANDKILPITVGDSYDIRINFEVTAKAGSAAALNFQLDIGGGAAPTIVVVDTQISINKTVPFETVATFPIFSLGTFITNGGQVFVSTDTGTATIAARSITIIRTSSGAS